MCQSNRLFFLPFSGLMVTLPESLGLPIRWCFLVGNATAFQYAVCSSVGQCNHFLPVQILHCLVGGLEHFLFFHILGIIIPIDFHIFQRGSNHQPVLHCGLHVHFLRSHPELGEPIGRLIHRRQKAYYFISPSRRTSPRSPCATCLMHRLNPK